MSLGEAPQALYPFQQGFPKSQHRTELNNAGVPSWSVWKSAHLWIRALRENDTPADKPASFLLSENAKNVFSPAFRFYLKYHKP